MEIPISSSFDPNLLMEKTPIVSSAGFAPALNPPTPTPQKKAALLFQLTSIFSHIKILINITDSSPADSISKKTYLLI
jgi:hypothetical protein